MWNTFKYTILTLVREKNVLIWAIAFPLVLATVFNFMFANLDEASDFRAIKVAVVEDAHYREASTLGQAITSVSEPGEDQLLSVTTAKTEAEAKSLLDEGAVEGYLIVDEEGAPSYQVGTLSSQTSSESINRTIVKNFLDIYVQDEAVLSKIIAENPAALQSEGAVEDLTTFRTHTKEISVTANDPSGTVRYFYALLGFSCIMAATVGLTAIAATLPGSSALGARRNVSSTSRATTLVATLAASWLLSFCCIMLGYLYVRYAFGIDFGGKDAACVLAIIVSSLVSTALGTCIGAIPRLGEGAKAGIMTGLSCFLALFAGLYGESSMQLADQLSKDAPVLQLLNPSKQVADVFYSLYYYDTYTRFFEVLIVLLITAAVLFVGAALLMRRQRYASI